MLNTLNVAQTGLRTSQAQVESVMNNIANENTEGYKKRVVNISELEQADSRITGRGVMIDDVSRVTNVYMYQNLVTEQSKSTNLNELNGMLEDIESIFHETDTSGMSADLNRYFQSIENLRTSPQSTIYKSDVTNNGNIVVDDLQRIYSDIETRENKTLNSEVKDTVKEVNNILQNIGDISQKIVDSPTPQNDLLDKRDSLEKELAKYIDVEIFRGDSYQLKIGGATAVRFDTNVHQLNLVENYTPQQDAYIYDPSDTNFDPTDPLKSNIIDTSTWGGAIQEEQTLTITGTVDDGSGDAAGTAKTVHFLGTKIDNTKMGDDATTTAANIVADKADVMASWNADSANDKKQIADLTDNGDGSITITYKTTDSSNTPLSGADADISVIDESYSVGLTYHRSEETVKGTPEDSITYTLNNTHSITVTNGEQVNWDINEDGNIDTSDIVDSTNAIKALVHKINQDRDIGSKITAYNGKYELDKDGNKILTDNPLHTKYDATNPDRYLYIEANVDGEAGKFVGEIVVNDNDNTDTDPLSPTYGNYIGVTVPKDTILTKKGIDDIHLEIYDKEVDIKGGSLNAMINNIKTDSGENDYSKYKEMLDNFALKLSDYSDSYIETADGEYIYGEDATQQYSPNGSQINSLNLFVGADVKSLQFQDNQVNTLTQQDLDYLATIQWKGDIDFKGTGEDTTSFSQYFQNLRVTIADDRENVIFNQKSQEAVQESLQSSYDKLTKVDKDEEMVNLIKFQSAYEANAKVITTINEMLQTLLGLKR